METAGETVVTTEESAVLSEGEVNTIVEGAPTEEAPTLPSDATEFTMPEKFAGKSAEEIAKSYLELEKFKGGGQESTEGEVPSEPEEGGEVTEIQQEQYDRYAQSLDDNGELSAEEYAELAKAGYDKATVDAEIAARNEEKEFQKYKADKALNDVLEPLGGGADKFKEVATWANETKTPEEVKAFNDALASSPKIAQQALLKGLYAEYDSSGTPDTILHTNTPQSLPSKGYKTQEEFFKDIGSEEYQNNPAYRAAVEAKMAKSNIF